MEDLLAENGRKNLKPFFTASEILPGKPVTIRDYRKLLIDLPGVKNAWLGAVPLATSEITYNEEYGELWFKLLPDNSDLAHFNGFLQVLIEPDEEEPDADAIANTLHQNRNLCEDFLQPIILPKERIGLRIDVEVDVQSDPTTLEANIWDSLANWVSPSIRFYTLAEMLAKGYRPDEIFQGSLLANGFIDNEELVKHKKRTSLRCSDLLHLLMDMPEVKVVREILMGKPDASELESYDLETADDPLSEDFPEKQYLKLEEKQAPSLGYLHLRMFKKHRKIWDSERKIEPPVEGEEEGQEEEPSSTTDELPVPQGKFRNPGRYFSITHDFPQNYGIGPNGLPAKATEKRKAQAKQLKAYLALFEQLLANYFSQLDNTRKLFALDYAGEEIYFFQHLAGADGIPGFEELLVDSNDSCLRETQETTPADRLTRHLACLEKGNDQLINKEDRQNRRLDHLLARFAEQYPDLDLLIGDSRCKDNRINLLKQKRKLLLSYPKISAGRGQGFNYTHKEDIGTTDNYSGLEKRLGLLLGIERGRPAVAQNLIIDVYGRPEGQPVKYYFQIRSRTSRKALLSSNTAYASSLECHKALAWAIWQLSKGEGIEIMPTGEETPRYYFQVFNPDGEKVGRRIEYFASEEIVQEVVDDVIDQIQTAFGRDAFYLLEHLLIRPDTSKQEQPSIYQPAWMTFIHSMTAYYKEPVDDPDSSIKKLWCVSPEHMLQKGNRIKVLKPEKYAGSYSVQEVEADRFAVLIKEESSPGPILPGPILPGHFSPGQPGAGGAIQIGTVNPGKGTSLNDLAFGGRNLNRILSDVGKWIQLDKAYHDPWSFQLSLIFPGWQEKFRGANMRSLVEEMVQEETPAHITPYVYWIEKEGQMVGFLAHYFSWREKITNDLVAATEAEWLNEFLGISKKQEIIHGLMSRRSGDHFSIENIELPLNKQQIALSFWMRIEELKFPENVPSPTTLGIVQGRISTIEGDFPVLDIMLEKNKIAFRCCANDLLYSPIDWQAYMGKWVHWVFLKDFTKGEMAIYLDGELLLSAEGKNALAEFPISFLAFGRIQSSNVRLSGTFADIRAWRGDFEITEVCENRWIRLAGTEPGLYAYWKLDEGIGNVAKDSVVHEDENNETATNKYPGEIHGCDWV
ncbi:MAG: hypothetical protein KDC75_03740 [Phaeodactylibacter sp.]|nr:hypothetical protein [Phaeodactylibacter sp.]